MDHVSAERVYQHLASAEMSTDVLFAHQMAYLRTFAAPRVARLLAHTGHIEHAPTKRATDTGLLLYELVHHGLDSPRGEEAVTAINRMHGRWKIRNDDSLWVLGTFVVPTVRFLDRFAWRRVTGQEREAIAAWYAALGERMLLHDVPATYADVEDLVDGYEARELERTDEGDRLFAASLPVSAAMLPSPLRRWSRPLFGVLIDEPARTALALPTPNAGLTAAVVAGMSARSMLERVRPGPGFVSGGAYGPYPDGYELPDLGVGDQAVLRPDDQPRATS